MFSSDFLSVCSLKFWNFRPFQIKDERAEEESTYRLDNVLGGDARFGCRKGVAPLGAPKRPRPFGVEAPSAMGVWDRWVGLFCSVSWSFSASFASFAVNAFAVAV